MLKFESWEGEKPGCFLASVFFEEHHDHKKERGLNSAVHAQL